MLDHSLWYYPDAFQAILHGSIQRRQPRQKELPLRPNQTPKGGSSTDCPRCSGTPTRDELYKYRSSRKIDSRRLFSRDYDFPKTYSLTENQFSGKTYFYTIASRLGQMGTGPRTAAAVRPRRPWTGLTSPWGTKRVNIFAKDDIKLGSHVRVGHHVHHMTCIGCPHLLGDWVGLT